eukprot:scaffold15488_cov62-Phaeocystis_antarctica.AAC.3
MRLRKVSATRRFLPPGAERADKGALASLTPAIRQLAYLLPVRLGGCAMSSSLSCPDFYRTPFLRCTALSPTALSPRSAALSLDVLSQPNETLVCSALGLAFFESCFAHRVCGCTWGLARGVLEGGYTSRSLYEKKDARLSCGVRALGVVYNWAVVQCRDQYMDALLVFSSSPTDRSRFGRPGSPGARTEVPRRIHTGPAAARRAAAG